MALAATLRTAEQRELRGRSEELNLLRVQLPKVYLYVLLVSYCLLNSYSLSLQNKKREKRTDVHLSYRQYINE